MHAAAGPHGHAWHSIRGEVNSIGSRAADDRRGALTRYQGLRGLESLNDRDVFLNHVRRISHIDVHFGFGMAGPLSEAPQNGAKVSLDRLESLPGTVRTSKYKLHS